MNHEHEDWQEPCKEEIDALFSDPNEVEILMENIDAAQHAAVMENETIKRAKEIYAQQKEKERKRSPHRTRLFIEEFDSNTRSWKERKDDD